MLFISTTGSASLIPTTALSRWVVAFVWHAYERLGIQIPPAHPGLCTQMWPLPKNIMPIREIFPRRTGIPRTPGWQYQPCTLDGDISASFHKKQWVGRIYLKPYLWETCWRVMSRVVLRREILECGYRFHTIASCLSRCTRIQRDIFWDHGHGLPSY